VLKEATYRTAADTVGFLLQRVVREWFDESDATGIRMLDDLHDKHLKLKKTKGCTTNRQ